VIEAIELDADIAAEEAELAAELAAEAALPVRAEVAELRIEEAKELPDAMAELAS